MIGYLEGEVMARGKDYVVLGTAGGVGYQVILPPPLLAEAGEPGRRAAFYIVTVTREGETALYGVPDLQHKALFELLISVSGIGPKAALAFLAAFSPAELVNAIVLEDVVLLATIPGIGKKTAARLCVELSDRLSKEASGGPAPAGVGARGDLLSALTNLGFPEKDVLAVLQKIPSENLAFAQQLKQALSMLGRN